MVTVKLGEITSTFALEYERTPKCKSAYMEIRERLQSETRVQRFLYLAATRNLLSFLIHCFANLPGRLYLGLSEHFLASPMDTPVVEAFSASGLSFGMRFDSPMILSYSFLNRFDHVLTGGESS